MREIKLRAWGNKEKKFSDGCCVYADGSWGLMFIVDNERFGEAEEERLPYDDDVIMQYTGLKDENGKEIFEGDILDHDGVRFDAAWDNVLGAWMCWPIQAEGPCHLYELAELSRIVGNIYENPEMIGHITIEGRINL